MRFLFFKHSLHWPRTRGHDVHTYFMMRALEQLGHDVMLLTVKRPDTAAVGGLTGWRGVTEEIYGKGPRVRLTGLAERFRSYWGVAREDLCALAGVVAERHPDAVVAAGPEALPYLAIVRGCERIWYAADDLAWQHLTQISGAGAASWANVRAGAINAFYERTFASAADRVWVVSPSDARAIRWIGGLDQVDLVPNGVDTDFFQPTREAEKPMSAVFWGNLGFGPNVRGLEWFCANVWPIVRQRRPGATLTIVGFGPSPQLLARSGRDGIAVLGALADVRGEISRHAIAVMPFRSGSGLKNKMLESAALGRATICSEAALNGLRGPYRDAFIVVSCPEEWAERMISLWDDDQERAAIGRCARRWVEENHTWRHAAEHALAGLCRGQEDRAYVAAAVSPGRG